MNKLLNKEVNLKNFIVTLLLTPIIILMIIIVLLILIGVIGLLIPDYYKDKMVLKGYSKKENIVNQIMFQDGLYYEKYYYNELNDDNFKNNKKYKSVSKENIESLNAYISEFENLSNTGIKSYGIKEISSDNYYYIEYGNNSMDFKLYYYDVNNHVLHILILN